ncbi:MAG: hypothetical protein JW857_10375 [Bacteroidales bacterium]|nr:hypothetical protein [Bacteroidales bacterium]
MAYNKYYYYTRIAEIQDIVLDEQKRDCGVTLIGIYRDRIRTKFHISYSTFNNYLGIPAKNLLKEMQENEPEKNFKNE